MEEDRDLETDRSLQVALPVSSADEESSDMIMVSDLRPFRIIRCERVAANVALRRVFVFLPFLRAHTIQSSIGSELLEDRRFLLDEDVQELGQRILSDLHHCQLIVLTESRAGNYCCRAHFVLLGVRCLIFLTTERLDDRFEVCIDEKRRYGTEFVVDEFKLKLF